MKGSEKQIAWAENLKANVIKCIDAIIDGNKNSPAYAQYKQQIDELVSTWEDRKSKLSVCDSASAIIDYFNFFKATGNIYKDEMSVNAIYNTTLNNGYNFK